MVSSERGTSFRAFAAVATAVPLAPAPRAMELRGMELRGMELRGMELRGTELSAEDVKAIELRGAEEGSPPLCPPLPSAVTGTAPAGTVSTAATDGWAAEIDAATEPTGAPPPEDVRDASCHREARGGAWREASSRWPRITKRGPVPTFKSPVEPKTAPDGSEIATVAEPVEPTVTVMV